MKLPTLSLAVVLALLGGALIGVIQKPGSSSPGAAASAKVKWRGSTTAGHPAEEPPAESGTGTDARGEGFAKLPRAVHGRLPELPESAAQPGAEEVKALKEKALEEILASIGSFPGLPEEHQDRLAAYAAQLATSDTPQVQCWGPGTPLEIVHAYLLVEQKIGQAAGMQVQALQLGSHWSQTATNGNGHNIQGQPVTVTWSIVPDGTPIPGSSAGDPSAPSALRARMAAIYGGSATGNPSAQAWFATFQATFDNLAANTGLRFVYEPNDDGSTVTSSANPGVLGVRGDIRLSGHPIDGNSGILAYAYYPDIGDMVLDTSDSFFNTTTNSSIRLRNVLEHELGHALGLAHVCPVNETKLMEPYVTSAFRGSQFDDIYSFQRHYGDTLEVRPGVNNNDTRANATPLSLTVGTTASWQWLSIDDNSDTDHYSFTASAQSKITVRIIPSDPILPTNPTVNTYLEGSQTSTCSSGSAFDPTNQQDLVLDLLNSSGTVVTSAPTSPAGQTEQILDFQVPAAGSYYIRVRGGASDRAQLYRMEVLLGTVQLAPQLAISSIRLYAESNVDGIGAIDPDETIRVGITLSNSGNGAVNNLNATLTGLNGTTIFAGTKSYGSIAPGGSAEQLFTFALSGSAGQVKTLQLALSGTGYSASFPLSFMLGTQVVNTPLDEHFDTLGSLPSGWSQSVTQQAAPWTVSDNFAKSLRGSAFAPAVATNGDATLVAPTVPIPEGGILEFAHRFDLDDKLDGAVLEAKIQGVYSDLWFDLITAQDVTVETGGYTGIIEAPPNYSSISGRNAWTGSSTGFITTRIRIPSFWAGKNLTLRWRVVHNNFRAVVGYNLDDVKLSAVSYFTFSFRPSLSLSASATALTEGQGPVTLTASTPLPLTRDLPVFFDLAGTASVNDVSGALDLTIPAGQTSVSTQLSAVADGVAEDSESLTLSIPGWSGAFSPLEPASVTVNIAEGIQAATVTLSKLALTYDGSGKSVTVTTNPAGLAVAITYNGSSSLPVNAGSYAVLATVTAPGFSGSASGTLVINSAYAAWIAGFPGSGGAAGLATADIDHDGWDNAAEYTFGTSPVNPGSVPQLVPVVTATAVQLMVPPAPPGITRFAETSTDLKTWTSSGVIPIAGGFQVARGGRKQFLRVVYQVTN